MGDRELFADGGAERRTRRPGCGTRTIFPAGDPHTARYGCSWGLPWNKPHRIAAQEKKKSKIKYREKRRAEWEFEMLVMVATASGCAALRCVFWVCC